MDLEELNKTQIILLTLLVSFVTSMATGITTVSLMEQAPPALTQTVQRVVERTVERVVPADTGVAPEVVTRERTVVVREADAVADAFARVEKTLYSIETKDGAFRAWGVGIGSDVIFADGASSAGEVLVFKNGDKSMEGVVRAEQGVLKVALTSVISAPILSTLPRLGSTIVIVAPKKEFALATGLVSSMTDHSFTISADHSRGSFLIDTTGNLVGLSKGETIIPLHTLAPQVLGTSTATTTGE